MISPVSVMNFRQTFVIGASWDKDEVIRFWSQRSKVKVALWCQRLTALSSAIEFSFLVVLSC